jgi:hypothetical protein
VLVDREIERLVRLARGDGHGVARGADGLARVPEDPHRRGVEVPRLVIVAGVARRFFEQLEGARLAAELRLRQRGVRRRVRVARQRRFAARIESLALRELERLRILRARQRELVARGADVAEVQTAGELRLEAARAGELLLHLRELEVGGETRLLRGQRQREKRE